MARRFRIRLRRKNKCIRWKKGTCSSTNPPVTTHRSVAPSICPSLLDDGTLLSEGISTNFGDNDLLSCSNTAVPDNATICTNATFNHVGNHHKIAEENKLINDEIINVLSGVTEVLRSDQSPLQEESDTAYFACLMTTLETAEQSELTTTAILYLLSVVIKKVDANVLQKEFDHINAVFMDVLRKYESTNETLLLRSWIKSYAWLLKCQQKENLKSESIMLILKFCNDSRHRVRKSCHGCLESILKSLTTNAVAVHPLTNTVYNYCTTNLEPYALNNDLLTSALISMYRSIIPFVSSENILCVCEYLLKLMPLRSQVIRNQCFQAMHTLFKSDYSHLDSDTNCKLINALYAYQPKNIEVTPLCTWIEVITFAHIRLFRLSIEYGWLHLPKLVNVSVKTLLCENAQICEAVNNSIQLQICNCIGKTIESQQIDKAAFLRYIQEFVNGFNSKFRIVWKFIFARFADLVEIMPVEYFFSIQKYISLVSQMRPNHNSLPNENETRKLIDLIICNSVKVFGPENVISAIPLTFNSGSCQFEPQWLVDIFKSSIENTSLMFFIKFFLPYAIKTQTSNDDKIQAECDIWSLFPAFCRSPTDSHVFSSISKGIGISMVKYAHLQPIILRGLLNLLKSSQKDKVLLKAVRKDAKNFLPILLNIYVGSLNRQDIHNLSYNTIYQLCKIIDCKLNEVYFTNLMQKVDTAQKKATRTLLLELLPCFIGKLSAEWRLKLYDISLELIDNEDYQKRGFRLLHELLCCSNSKSLYDLDNTLEILLKSKTSVVDAARHSKLSCLNMLFLSIDHMSLAYLTSLFKECLHCICTGSNKTVKLAMNLLLNLCQYRIENDKTCTESDLFFDLCKSVDKFTRDHEQTTVAQCCCANVLTQLVKQYKHLVIGQCVNWLMNKVKELFNISNEMSRVFNRACVLCATLIKILDSIVLMAMLDPLLRALFTNYKGNTSRAKSKLKIALRLLAEKVGLDMVVNHLPVSDPSINVIIRNIRKSIRKDRSNENKAETVVTSSFAPTLRSTATTKISKRLKRKRQAMETSANTIIKEDDGHPLDLLDTESIARFHIPNIKSDCGNEEDAFTLDSSGRIVVQLENDEDRVESDTTSQDIDQQINSLSLGVNKNEKSASFGVKKRKYAHSGEQYMSKRARGDVKKKDKPDPYAYIPLTSDMANKRKTTKSGKQFKTAVRKAKLGAQRAARHGHKRRM